MVSDYFFNMWYSICIVFQSMYTVKIPDVKIWGFCSINEQLDKAKHGFNSLFYLTKKFTLLIEDRHM